MKIKLRTTPLYLLAMMSVVALMLSVSCLENEYILNVSVEPQGEGNYVYIYELESVKGGEIQTLEMNENTLLYKMQKSGPFTVVSWINKVRLVAVPGPGYKFDRWVGSRVSSTADSVDIKAYHGSEDLIGAHFVKISPPPGESLSEGEKPEDTGDPSEWLEDEAEVTPDTVLSVNLLPKVEIIDSPSGCISSILNLGYEATDHSGGGHPVNFVQLKKDGQVWSTWQGVPTAHYQEDKLIEIPCLGATNLELIATNRDGVEVDVAKQILIPHVVSKLTWEPIEVPGEECRMELKFDLEGIDNYGPTEQLASLVLTANGDPWYEEYGLTTDIHKHSFSKVLTCGHIYSMNLTATDVDGNKYTWRETIEIPTPEPEDEPPEEPPDAPPAEETLYVAFALSGQCTWTEKGCKCTVNYSVDAEDRSAGDKYPVTNVKFEVNDGSGWKVWHDSGPISTSAYHYAGKKTEVDCDKYFNVRVTATNSIGQTVTNTGSFTTASP